MTTLPPYCSVHGCLGKANYCFPGRKDPIMCCKHGRELYAYGSTHYVYIGDLCSEPGCIAQNLRKPHRKCRLHAPQNPADEVPPQLVPRDDDEIPSQPTTPQKKMNPAIPHIIEADMDQQPTQCTIEGCKNSACFCKHGTKTPTICSMHAQTVRDGLGRRYVQFSHICTEPGCVARHTRDKHKKCAAHMPKEAPAVVEAAAAAPKEARGASVEAKRRIGELLAEDPLLEPPALKRRDSQIERAPQPAKDDAAPLNSEMRAIFPGAAPSNQSPGIVFADVHPERLMVMTCVHCHKVNFIRATP